MVLPQRQTQEPRRPLPRARGWTRRFSSFLRFQQYRPDEVSVSSVIVSLDGSGDFDSIQAAIDSLPDTGGEVIIKEGTYTLTSRPSVITFSQKDNVTLRGAGKSTIITSPIDMILLRVIRSDDVIIENIYFLGIGSGNSGNGGISVSSTTERNIIRNCWFENFGSAAISISAGTDSLVENCKITSNFSSGILASNEATFVAKGNLINSNLVGIRLISLTAAKILDNYINSNTNEGILIETISNEHIISGNTINSNGDDGISLESTGVPASDKCIIDNNIINDNGAFGVLINTNSDRNTVDSNQIINNASGDINDLGTNTQIGHNITR